MTTKKVYAPEKTISCQQKQDDAAQKNILFSKKLLIFSGVARHIYCLILTFTNKNKIRKKCRSSDK